MTRLTIALLLASLSLPVTAQTIYKCTDASGASIVSNSRVEKNCKAITNVSEVALGMSKAKVLSVAGNPSRKNISKKQGLVREFWFYGGSNTVVLENGVVVEILSNE